MDRWARCELVAERPHAEVWIVGDERVCRRFVDLLGRHQLWHQDKDGKQQQFSGCHVVLVFGVCVKIIQSSD